jgi:hypothetical protein
MDRIYLSTIGDFENPSAVAEGNLDNVSLRLIIPSGEPGTPSTTSSPTIVTGGGTQTVTLPVSSTPSAPVTVPTKSGIPVLVILAALAGAALLARSKVR